MTEESCHQQTVGPAVHDSILGIQGMCQLIGSLDQATLSASNYQQLASLVNKERTEINNLDMHRLNRQRIKRQCIAQFLWIHNTIQLTLEIEK